jgi:peroxiredoxin
LRRRYEDITATGAEVVAIGTGDQRYAAAFVADEDVPFPVLVDDDGQAAKAAAVRSAGVAGIMRPSALAGSLRAFRGGQRQKRTGDRPMQLGATFVVGPGEQVRYEHVDGHTADHAPLDEVLSALPS